MTVTVTLSEVLWLSAGIYTVIAIDSFWVWWQGKKEQQS